MEITLKEVKELEKGTYEIIDIRSESELSYGKMPDSKAISEKELLENPPEDKGKKYVICCHKGCASEKTAMELRKRGYDAVSLAGGYITWLMDTVMHQENEEISEKVERSLQKKFRKTIWSPFTKAVKTYELVKEGDCIAVCISGGKDSMLMAKLFQQLQKISEVPFEVKYLVMDPGYSAANRMVINENTRRLKIPAQVFDSNIFGSVYHIEKSPCYLCARMRR